MMVAKVVVVVGEGRCFLAMVEVVVRKPHISAKWVVEELHIQAMVVGVGVVVFHVQEKGVGSEEVELHVLEAKAEVGEVEVEVLKEGVVAIYLQKNFEKEHCTHQEVGVEVVQGS